MRLLDCAYLFRFSRQKLRLHCAAMRVHCAAKEEIVTTIWRRGVDTTVILCILAPCEAIVPTVYHLVSKW